MANSIRIVQLLHPGVAHHPGPDGSKPWNCGPHRRAFVRQTGRCLPRLGVEPVREQLDFWCEWEAEADLIQRIHAPVNEGPRHLFKPRLYAKSNYRGLQNTDPCVFGGFYYCICQQRGVLKKLGRGSVVLFGSCLNNRFVIDTVFVVKSHDEYDRKSINDLKVSEAYRAVGLGPLFPNAAKKCGPKTPSESYRLYRGATVDAPVDDMFSFFPCLPASEEPGFARPTIELPDYVTANHRQGYRTEVVNLKTAKQVWMDVVRQVLRHGLWLGVGATMPRIIKKQQVHRPSCPASEVGCGDD